MNSVAAYSHHIFLPTSGFPSDHLSSLDLSAVVVVVSKAALSVLGT